MQKRNNANTLNLPKKWQSLRKENTVTLGGVLYKYNSINTNAIKNGRMQIIDSRSNRPVSPNIASAPNGVSADFAVFKENPNPTAQARNTPLYTSSYAFAIAPSINSLNVSNFSVTLPREIFATNTNIRSLQINFGDGNGYRNINFNTPVQVNYKHKNTYTWVFKTVLTNGTTLYSHSKIKINQLNNPNTAYRTPQGHIANRTRVSVRGFKGFLEVRDANGDGIRKPLIIAEGLDPGIITSPEKQTGENDLEDFENSTLSHNSNSFLLHNKIFGNEYDIIYVNWRNGLDYIENNAEVLKEVIRMVNRAKRANNSTEKNVVLGQSMGGLIARYALKDMEDNNENHDTRLYISHDAPHQGANAPISVQYLLRHIRKVVIRNPLVYFGANSIVPIFNNGKTGYDYYNILDNPATRQMMINWVNKDYHIDNSFHNNWQNKLKAKGYPQQTTKNIAIANGHVCGNFQNVANSILNINKKFSYPALQDFLTEIIAGQHSRGDLALLANIPGYQKYTFNFNCKPILRNNAGGTIYNGNISYKKKILWFIPVSVTLDNKKLVQPSGLLPYDELPGSFFSLDVNAVPIKDIVQNPSTFIPNLSALDYGRGNINHSQSVYENVIYHNNPNIPFNDYILERENRLHISFSNESSQWLINMLDEQPHTNNEALYCTKDKKIDITQNFNCGGVGKLNANFNAPRFEWSIIRGRNLITNLSNIQQRQITFNTPSNSSGEVIVQLRYGDINFSRTNTINKSFWIGKPRAYVSNDATICSQVFLQDSDFILPVSPGADRYEIKSNHTNLTILQSSITPNEPIVFMARASGHYTATLTTFNKCGSSSRTIYVHAKRCNNFGDSFNFRVYPNPISNNNLTIESNENNFNNYKDSNYNSYSIRKQSFQKKEELFNYELYNFQNVLIKRGKLNNNKANINLPYLRTGVYILRIFNKDSIEIHNLIVE